jgi:Cof subfamily protein (haloacid dehalogenase superfamily)
MAYKMVCIDMDGTLLDSRKQISATNIAMLQKAHAQGVRIVISTGRTYADAQYYSGLIGIEAAIIAANGAYIQAAKEEEPIYQSCLGPDLAAQILNTCRQYRIAPNFHTPQKEYYGSWLMTIRWALLSFRTGVSRNATHARKMVRGYQSWKRVIAAEQGRIVKCVVIGFNRQKLQRLREEFAQNEALEVVSSWTNNLELNCKGITKGKGVELLARHYNIKREEIIAIGDSENDLSMLEYAGLGVAMGNAAPAIKRKADLVTAANDDDGVAKVIAKYVLDPKTALR